MNILAIDTVSNLCSVAYWGDAVGQHMLARKSDEARSHARLLVPFCHELIEEAGCPPDAIALVAGPGSYTGLRIGASSAKGLAYALDIPLYAVSTLEYLAHSLPETMRGDHLLSLLPARKTEVFAAVFEVNDGIQTRLTPDVPIEIEDLRNLTTGSDAVTLLSNSSETLEASKALYPGAETVLVAHDASRLHGVLRNRMEDFRVKDLHSFEPSYLKEFVAKKAARNIFDRLPF